MAQETLYVVHYSKYNTDRMIYLDHAATTPMSQRALTAYREAAERFYGNASSLHDVGSEAQRALEGARKLIAGQLGVPERGLYFTGSGSEASFLAITSLATADIAQGGHLITTEAEHSSVRETVHWLEKHRGFEITRLPLEANGCVKPEKVSAALRENTTLVSIQFVNSEIGTVQPLEEIGKLLNEHPARFHSDLVQGFGKLPANPADWHLDSFTLSAHKIHGPKGIGAAWIHPSRSWRPFFADVTHESGFRPGTVDVPAAVSFAAAAREAGDSLTDRLNRTTDLRATLVRELEEKSDGRIFVEGDAEFCSPYILGLRMDGMEGQYAMLELSQKGVAVSTGSACQVNQQKPSATLLSMGYTPDQAIQFIRLSLDGTTRSDEVHKAAEHLRDILNHHRTRAGA